MKAKARVKNNGLVEVKVLAKHPMETGLRKDKEGNLVPAHYIEQLTATVGGEQVFVANLGTGVSKNPYVRFFYQGSSGDTVDLAWVDNRQQSETIQVQVK